jgi:ribonuclease J
MNINLKKFKKELLFLPLGGSGEIGLNCNLYHYEGKWLMIDCGIGFSNEIPGVDVVVPDISFIRERKKDLLGIVITHIHEDHLGAIPYLWEQLKAPIYASKFASAFLKEKLSKSEFLDKVKIKEINDGAKIKLKPFELEFIGLTHSTVEMNAILIKTKAGNVLHTGDWKLDENPVAGKKSNMQRLQELGNHREILATVCDSTNIFTEGDSRSESELLDSFKKIISKRNGAVVCATFASNISRVKTLIKAGKDCGRKICLLGSALLRIVKVAKQTGYLPQEMKFISDKELKKHKKSELLILATGCQGESLAALNKLTDDTQAKIVLNKRDTVIFSSKIIPGNEKSIMKLYNKLSEKDVEIINEENAFVHVSGHYSRKDLVKFYKYTKPYVAIATHGEATHLSEHKRLAEKYGIEKVLKAKNGVLVLLNKDNPRAVEKN